MAGSDIKERLRELPRRHQRTSCPAVIDSAQFTFALKNIQRPVRAAFDDPCIRLRHECSQSNSSYVMQNPSRVRKLPIEQAPFGGAFSNNRARQAVAPARP